MHMYIKDGAFWTQHFINFAVKTTFFVHSAQPLLNLFFCSVWPQIAKDMRADLNPFSFTKLRSQTFVRLAVSFLLLGLVFRFLASDSLKSYSSPDKETTIKTDSPLVSSLPVEASGATNSVAANQTKPSVPVDFAANRTQTYQSTGNQCDLFTGDWIPDRSGPVYTNRSCPEIEDHQNCMRNGRTDSGYLYWKWRPKSCDLPRFDAKKFLHLMRNKNWGFIGDSISRNHVQSLLCILSQVDEAIEIYHDEEFRSKIWRFQAHNFTLSVIWTPLLIKADIFEDKNGVSSSELHLHLDQLDTRWTEQYHKFDYMVIAGGKWFLKTAVYYENNIVIGCHYCPGMNLTELGFNYAYRKTLSLIFYFIVQSNHRASIFFRTTTPDHFENGEWFSGGVCNRTVPFKEGEVDMGDVDTAMRDIELEEFERAAALGSEKGLVLKLLDTTRLSLLRPDGHPGPYRQFQPFAEENHSAEVQNDCLHWCLPGPIDAWNDLVMEMIVRSR